MSALKRVLVLCAVAACASVLAVGCALFGGQTGQEDKDSTGSGGNPCDADAGMGADLGDASVEDVISTLGDQFTAPFVWTDRQAATDVTIELRYDAEGAYRTHNDCGPERLEIPVTLSIATDDGLLDERATTTLSVTGRKSGALEAVIPLSKVGGTYDASEIEDASPSATELRVTVIVDAGTTRGQILVSTKHSSNGIGMESLGQAGAWPERL